MILCSVLFTTPESEVRIILNFYLIKDIMNKIIFCKIVLKIMVNKIYFVLDFILEQKLEVCVIKKDGLSGN